MKTQCPDCRSKLDRVEINDEVYYLCERCMKQEVEVVERMKEKLQPASVPLLESMLINGQARVRNGKIAIASGYESLALGFQFK